MDVRFWRNVTLIGLAHVALVAGLIRWSSQTKAVPSQSVVWMNGGAGDGAPALAEASVPPLEPAEAAPSPPEPQSDATVQEEEDHPVLTSATSEIQLPLPTPSPPPATPSPKPTATPVVKASPKPTPKATPKPSPKPSAKPKPKPKPAATPKKLVLAKASPKPTPKVKPAQMEPDEDQEEKKTEEEKKEIVRAALEKTRATAAQSGTGKGTSAGAGGHANGSGGESQFGWYGSMLHDRFYSEWVQPSTSLTSGSKASATVKIRIEKDGRVSSFEIIKASGNPVVDDSVAAMGKRVTQVDPLPAGLGNGEHYDVKIKFELNADQ